MNSWDAFRIGLSRALRYRQVLENLESALGRRLDIIHIVGGGSQNELLNQLTADCTGRRVVAGPTEATAAGNVMVQAIGSGLVPNLAEARQVVKASFPVKTVEQTNNTGWNQAYEKFKTLS